MRSVEKKFPILVPDYRFDQKKEMFKRRIWDKDFIEPGKRLYSEVKYQILFIQSAKSCLNLMSS